MLKKTGVIDLVKVVRKKIYTLFSDCLQDKREDYHNLFLCCIVYHNCIHS